MTSVIVKHITPVDEQNYVKQEKLEDEDYLCKGVLGSKLLMKSQLSLKKCWASLSESQRYLAENDESV